MNRLAVGIAQITFESTMMPTMPPIQRIGLPLADSPKASKNFVIAGKSVFMLLKMFAKRGKTNVIITARVPNAITEHDGIQHWRSSPSS